MNLPKELILHIFSCFKDDSYIDSKTFIQLFLLSKELNEKIKTKKKLFERRLKIKNAITKNALLDTVIFPCLIQMIEKNAEIQKNKDFFLFFHTWIAYQSIAHSFTQKMILYIQLYQPIKNRFEFIYDYMEYAITKNVIPKEFVDELNPLFRSLDKTLKEFSHDFVVNIIQLLTNPVEDAFNPSSESYQKNLISS
jgi:hypothetical protein